MFCRSKRSGKILNSWDFNLKIIFREKWYPLPSIEVAENMVEFGSAITMQNQIYVFGGMFADSVPTDSVFRYNQMLWEEIQKLSRPRSNHYSLLVQSDVVIHVSTAPDSVEQWIYDRSSDTFLIETFDLSLFNGENTILDQNSRPLIVPIVGNSSHWSKWTNWSSNQSESGIWNRQRCNRNDTDCQTQLGFFKLVDGIIYTTYIKQSL